MVFGTGSTGQVRVLDENAAIRAKEQKKTRQVEQFWYDFFCGIISAGSGVESGMQVRANECNDLKRVNEALARAFFGGRFQGRPVFLTLDNQGRTEVAKCLRVDFDDFESRCCEMVGRNLCTGDNPYREIVASAREWEKAGQPGFPPFIAVLFALSHAAELMGEKDEFAQNNYYVRLAQVLGFPRAPLAKHAKSTDVLWRLLAGWLEEQDYERGRPTASSIGNWKYVGKAMSQAIVRANDRHQFHDLFEKYGFSSGDRSAPDQLLIYLADWMTTSRPSSRLKSAWGKLELRNRIAEVAASELEEWEGAAVGGASEGRPAIQSGLILLATIVPSFPTSRLSLALGQARELSAAIEGLKDATGNTYTLSNEQYGSFATLSPSPLGKGARALANNVSLQSSHASLGWRSSLVIPLASSGDGPYWTEVRRVSRHETHMLLVKRKKTIVDELGLILTLFSTGEASVATSSDLPGLPDGWLLYRDVCITASSFEASDDLQVLVPNSDGQGFAFKGGMQLGRGIYHSADPPGVLFLAKASPSEVRVSRPGPAGQVVVQEHASRGPTCNVQMNGLGDGTFTLSGAAGKKPSSCQVLLRSAARARPNPLQNAERLVHASIFSASPADEVKSPAHVEGLAIACEEENLGALEVGLASYTTHNVKACPEDRSQELEDAVDEVAIEKLPSSESCASRGYHYWICAYRKTKVSLSTPLRQVCRDCGRSVLIAQRGKKQPKRRGQAPSVPTPRPKPVKRLDTNLLNRQALVDHDLMLDALGYLGQGSWRRFEGLLASHETAPWYSVELARDLSALGHLDIRYRHGSHGVLSWSVPATCIGFASREAGYLSGFRSLPLLEEIQNAIERAGGRYIKVSSTRGPKAIRIAGIDPAGVRAALQDVQGPLGRAPLVTENVPARLAMACLQVAGLGAALAPASAGSNLRNLQRFDVETARWRTVDEIRGEGAYRFNHAGRTYLYRSKDGRDAVGPHQLVKLLAARAVGRHLHGYDQESRCFVSTRGAEPVGLLERALVAASGELPTTNEHGLTSYRQVEPEVGAAILHILYEGEIGW